MTSFFIYFVRTKHIWMLTSRIRGLYLLCNVFLVQRLWNLFFILNSDEHVICPANKYQNTNNFNIFFFCWIELSFKFILLINIKMPTAVYILIFISKINFMLNWVEHEKCFMTSGPWLFHYVKGSGSEQPSSPPPPPPTHTHLNPTLYKESGVCRVIHYVSLFF